MSDGVMDYWKFLGRVIDDGIAAAKADYAKPRQKDQLEGSIAGFEACRKKAPLELKNLLEMARQQTRSARVQEAENYWWFRCYELEIEWVCNVVSAAMMNQGAGQIVPPTGRGLMKAAEI